MNANELLALVGGVIVAGFLANVIFKVFKIPAVVKLMGIGLLLGPVSGLFPGEQFMDMAPVFGKLALLIILFAGGLGLRIQTVMAQLGNAVLLALMAFFATFALSIPACIFLLELGMTQSIILSTLVAGTASSIVIPVVTKLSVSEGVKTMISLESAISNLLILVVVIIVCDISVSENADVFSIFLNFFSKILVSLISAIIAGVLWARLIGSLRTNQLSYMLTLGFIFLLNYLVDKAGGSGAISILFFGISLANVSTIVAQFGPKIQKVLGIEVDSTKFVLNEFLKGISGELSFLVATFFFVFLGLLVSFDALTPVMIRNILVLIVIIVLGRLMVVPIFSRFSKSKYTKAEGLIMLSMMPRGLATAVMAFTPFEEPYFIEGTEQFPLYAMMTILGSNLIMTGLVKLGEIRLKKEREAKGEIKETESLEKLSEGSEGGIIPEETGERLEGEVSKEVKKGGLKVEEVDYAYAFTASKLDEEEPDPKDIIPFSERLYHWLGIRKESFIVFDNEVIKSLRIRDAMYWIKLAIMVVLTTLGLMMNNPAVIIAALLLSPITSIFNTIAYGIVTGDIYIFLKGNFKFLVSTGLVIVVAGMVTGVTPFTGMTEEIANRLNPHVLDFLLALVTGLVLPVILLRGNKFEIMAITPVVSLLLIPPLAVVGFAFGAGTTHGLSLGQILAGGILSSAASYTAMMIGAVLSQWFLGLTKHPSSVMIKKWKEKEVEEGVLHNWFERLRLVKALETVGTFYARIIVLGILAIAIFVPLQITYSKLQKEYKIDQVLADQSRIFFEKEDGSATVISRNFELKNKTVFVTMTVTKDGNYPQIYSHQFETAVSNKIELPCKLRLIQFNSEFADEGNLPPIPGEEELNVSYLQKVEEIEAELEAVKLALPGFSTLKIIRIRSQFQKGNQSPELIVECYSPDKKIHPDTRTLLLGELSGRLQINKESIRLVWIPPEYMGDAGASLEGFWDEMYLYSAKEILQSESEIGGEFLFPNSLPEDSLTLLITHLKARDSMLQDSLRFSFSSHDEDVYLLRLK